LLLVPLNRDEDLGISAWVGETEAAIAEFEKAMRLSPLEPQWGGHYKHGMASTLLWAGRPEEALPWVRKAIQQLPDLSLFHRTLIAALWLAAKHTEAKEAARKYVERFPGFSVRRAQEVSPVRHTAGQDRYFDALREAGLPE
jgi:tetratricopeptide (TPR) repeat protein